MVSDSQYIPDHGLCRFAGWTVDSSTREIYKGSIRTTLEPKTFQILELLLKHEGRVVTYATFEACLWRNVRVEVVPNVNVRIKHLRDILGKRSDFQVILNKRGVGYHLNPTITVEWGTTAEHTAPVASETSAAAPPAVETPRASPETSSSVEQLAVSDPLPASARESRIPEPVHLSLPPRAKRGLYFIAAALVLFSLAAAIWRRSSVRHPPTDWKVEGRTLTILDDRGMIKWAHTFGNFLYDEPRGGENAHPQVLFSDFDGDGKNEVLYNYFPIDPRTGEVPDGGAELHCFSEDGAVRWKRKFGSAFITPGGRRYPASRYHLLVLDRLRKPRADGGLIVAGGHHAGSWAFELALYTADGRKVGDYLHPGWLYTMLIADVNGDGSDEIVLGGVNNGFGDRDYGATLVVLDSHRFGGQGSVPPGDDRTAVGRATGVEAAVVLFPEFAQGPDQQRYCRVEKLRYAAGIIDVEVGKDSDSLPRVYYRFGSDLRLLGVQPDLNFAAQILKVLPPHPSYEQRQSLFMHTLGHLTYLRNQYSPTNSAGLPRRNGSPDRP